MFSTTNCAMKNVSELALQLRLQELNQLNMNKIVYSPLSEDQINKLAVKINLLPLEYQNILFFRYCFESTDYEIDNILGIKDTKSKLLYIRNLLSKIMKLENSWIDDNSLRESCRLALEESMKDYNNIESVYQPTYSKSFRRKLKGIKIPKRSTNIVMTMVKRVALLILVCFLSFSTVLAVNVEAREKFFDWAVETFPKFSIFRSQKMNDSNNLTNIHSFKINYIPSEFELSDVYENPNMIIYEYRTWDEQRLIIKLIYSSSESKSYYNTENIEIEEIIFRGYEAYTWETDEIIHLLWFQDGIEFHISADLELGKSEIFKVGENILE